MLCFSSSSVIFRLVMWGFRPLSKLTMQAIALAMVRIMRIIVIIAIIKLALEPHVQNNFFSTELTKGRQTSPCRYVIRSILGLVHPDQLEDKISQCGEQSPHDKSHGDLLLPSGAPGCENQECDSEWEDNNREVKLVVPASTSVFSSVAQSGGDDDNELNGEADEEEEIEFEQSNKNLE